MTRALLEMAGKNLFRAHIAQVAAKQDLRVEIELAAPLEREGNNLIWRYPLVEDAQDVALDWLRVRVETPTGIATKNNMGAHEGESEILWRKYNFKPDVDVRVAFPTKPVSAPLQADLSAEHTSDVNGILDEGFFAIDLKTTTNPATPPELSGVATSEITRIERPTPGVARVFGRYSGSGNAVVRWGDEKAVVFFPRPPQGDVREVARLVEALWGARRIKELSADPKNQEHVQALSHRFGLASKYTTWLAMPIAQRHAYEDEVRRINTVRKGAELSRIVAIEVEANRPFSPLALGARAGLRALERSSAGRKSGFVEQDARLNGLRVRMKELAKEVVARRLGLPDRGELNAGTYLTRLAAVGEQDEGDFLQNAQQGLRFQQVKALKARYTGEVCALRGSEPKVQVLKTQIKALENRYGIADDNFETKAMRLATQGVAKATLEEALQGREDTEHAAILRDTGERFTRILGNNSFEKAFFQPQIEARLGKASDDLLEEIEAGRNHSERAVSARREVEALYALAPGLRNNLRSVGSREWQRDLAGRARAHEAAYRLAQSRRDGTGKEAMQDDLQGQLDELSNQTDQDASESPKANPAQTNGQSSQTGNQSRSHSGATLSVKAPRDSRQVMANFSDGTAVPLAWNNTNERFETRFSAPVSGSEGTETIAVSVVAANGNRQKFSMALPVDAPKPDGDGGKRKLKFSGDSATDRVSALLPWGRVELQAQENGAFAAQVGVPAAWKNRQTKVRFLVLDKAGNATEIEVNWR